MSSRQDTPDNPLELVVGLEVHAALDTKTKLFSPIAIDPEAPPNSRTGPVCLGLPGALPVLNPAAVERGLRLALALDCELARTLVFDRKSYNYADQPRNYQITQWRRPLGRGGRLPLMDGRTLPLRELHLEDDAGRLIHDAEATHMDFNRAGGPLVELVTEPAIHDLTTLEDAMLTLRALIRRIGAGRARMERGELRFEANVSLRPRASSTLGARVEIKNLNSIAHVLAAVRFEESRQRELIQAGRPVHPETRTLLDESGRTKRLRSKESAAEYRYSPEPDLPARPLAPELVERARARDLRPPPVLAAALTEAGLTPSDARSVALELELERPVLALMAAGLGPSRALMLTRNELRAHLSPSELLAPSRWTIPASDWAALEALCEAGQLARATAREQAPAALAVARAGQDRRPVRELLAEQGLLIDPEVESAKIRQAVAAAFAADPAAVRSFRAGRSKALGPLIGAARRAAGPSVDVRRLREALLAALAEPE